MSDLIAGKHLEPEHLDGQNIGGELERFGQWAETVKFQPLSPGIEKCGDKDRDQKVRLVLKELGYENKLEIKYQILRIVSRSYITGSHAYLIPLRIEEGTSPTIYDLSTAASKLVVGQKIYFNRPIIVDPGIDCLLITAG